MSPSVIPLPGTGPQLWPAKGCKQHGMYKYKHAHQLTCTQRQKHINASTNYLSVSSVLLLLTHRYGRAHTLLPDITAHSCMPRAFAISSPNPDSHQPHSTASQSPRGSFAAGHRAGLFPASLARYSPSYKPWNRTYPSFTPASVSQSVLGEKLSCSCSHPLIHSLHDEVIQKWLRPQQQWIKMTKSCWNVNEFLQILLLLNIVLFSCSSGFF